MTPSLLSHDTQDVNAYCSTGVSPGQEEGRTNRTISLDHHGQCNVDLLWEAHGPASGSPVLVLGGISASHHLAPTRGNPSHGWWPSVVGSGGGLDPLVDRLIGVEYIGGSRCPLTGSAPITTQDQALSLIHI